MAGEVEADVWERVAAEMVSAQAHSSVGGGLVRAFIKDLGRVVDGRKVGWTYVVSGPARVTTGISMKRDWSPLSREVVRMCESQYSMRLILQEISRRELRKALERQGVTSLMEEEFLVLCDSLDLERRGRVRLADVRDSLDRGMVVAGRSSEGEVCTAGGVAAEMFPARRRNSQESKCPMCGGRG